MANETNTPKTETATNSGRRARPERKAPAPEPIELDGAKKLVIVESPAKAKTINKYLGQEYRVAASMGHVRDLPRNRLGIDIEHNFTPRYVEIASKKKHTAELRKAAKQAEEVYLCPDPDREGEAIAWHLVETLKIPPERAKRVTFNEITRRAVQEAFKRPRSIDLNLVNAQQARRILDRLVGYKLSPLLWKKVIKRLSAGRVQSVAVRLICEREAEIERFKPEEFWRIKAVLAAGTEENAPTFEAELKGRRRERRPDERCPLCGGPVKELTTPRGTVLKCTKAAQTSEQNGAESSENEGSCPGSLTILRDGSVIEPIRLKSADDAKKIIAELKGQRFTVWDVSKREVKANPYPPFSTSTLQQAAATRLGFTAKKTMMLAQRLYEGVELGRMGSVALITYMRTDSFRLAPEAIDEARKFIAAKYGGDYLPEQPNIYRSRKGSQEAHEAIRPTQASMTPDSLEQYLEPDMLKLYRLIWQRFIACQMTSARYEETSVLLLSGDLVFSTSGRVMLFPGYTVVYSPGTSAEEDSEGPSVSGRFVRKGTSAEQAKLLPPLERSQELVCRELKSSQHFTQPPPRYTEASLVKTLEREGIGRPSTYATIISTIQERGYVRKEGGSFKATDLGRLVNEKLVTYFPSLIDVRFTAEMEERLDKIEEGSENWVELLKQFYESFLKDLERAEREMPEEKDAPAPGGERCPVCGREMVLKLSRKGKFLGCSGFPECKYSWPLGPDGKPVELPEVARQKMCERCGKLMVLRTSRGGLFLACTGFPNCRNVIPLDKDGKPIELEPTNEKCDKCGAPMQVKIGRWGKFLSCTAYPKCRNTKRLPGTLPGEPVPGAPPCEKCGSQMVLKRTARGGYLLCSRYPDCKYRRSAEGFLASAEAEPAAE